MTASVSHAAVPAPITAYKRADLASAFRRVCANSELYWTSMSAAEFAAPLGATWSPADHVRHLTISVRAVERGLRLPGMVLRLLFGAPGGASRRYDTLVEHYRSALRSGGLAGRFSPSRQAVPTDAESYRQHVLAAHRSAVDALADRLLALTHDFVDFRRLPHPLLGRLTVREMLMFTLYHNQHHVWVVARRRGEHADESTPLVAAAQ